MLNIIGGLETPTEGKVLVDGAEVTGPGPDRGIVFQQYALFPWLTVEKNVQFGLKLQGKSKEEAEELAHKYLKMVDLEGFAKAYPKELSGGMKQRVAIALSLIHIWWGSMVSVKSDTLTAEVVAISPSRSWR